MKIKDSRGHVTIQGSMRPMKLTRTPNPARRWGVYQYFGQPGLKFGIQFTSSGKDYLYQAPSADVLNFWQAQLNPAADAAAPPYYFGEYYNGFTKNYFVCSQL